MTLDADAEVLPTQHWPDPSTVAVGGVEVTCALLRPGNDRLIVMKAPSVVRRYLDLIDVERPRRIVELGTKEGGSAALLAAASTAERVLTVDLADEVPPALVEAIDRAGLGDRLVARTGIDQGDRRALAAALADAGIDGEIDLVVDDASHLLEPTRSSFETIFPLLRPGGLYIVEDWSVDVHLADAVAARVAPEERAERISAIRTLFHRLNDPQFVVPDSISALAQDADVAAAAASGMPGDVTGVLGFIVAIATHAPLDGLRDLGEPVGRPLFELAVELAAIGINGGIIDEVRSDGDWLAVRRGPAELDPATFRLADHWTDHFGYLS